MSTNATLPAFDPHDPAGIDDLLTDDERAVRPRSAGSVKASSPTSRAGSRKAGSRIPGS